MEELGREKSSGGVKESLWRLKRNSWEVKKGSWSLLSFGIMELA